MNKEFILKQLNSKSQELNFDATNLKELSELDREIIETKIIKLCLQGNKTAFQYIPYLSIKDLELYFGDEINVYLDNDDINLINTYMYFRNKDKEYLSKIDINNISIDNFIIMVKYYKINKNDEYLFSKINEIMSINSSYRSIYNTFNNKKKLDWHVVTSGILGFAIGDALGVPVEFKSRTTLKYRPVSDMLSYGQHYMPEGTWSDDTSMTIATMDSIIEKGNIDYDDIMKKYYEWLSNAKYTATDKVFDIGITTRQAINSYSLGKTVALLSGANDINSNGNGSLMRMLPVAYYLYATNIEEEEKVRIVNNMSSLTHAHEISKLGCLIFCDYMKIILGGMNKQEAYETIKNIDYSKYYSRESIEKYARILKNNIAELPRSEIDSHGYIVSSLEASFWCTLNSNSYEEAVLKAVNLGFDTDTIGAITGAINGCIYGKDNIPAKWLNKLKKKNYLEYLSLKYAETLNTIEVFESKQTFSLNEKNTNYNNHITEIDRHEFPEANFVFIDDSKGIKR